MEKMEYYCPTRKEGVQLGKCFLSKLHEGKASSDFSVFLVGIDFILMKWNIEKKSFLGTKKEIEAFPKPQNRLVSLKKIL
jgi:hypothetical protein